MNLQNKNITSNIEINNNSTNNEINIKNLTDSPITNIENKRFIYKAEKTALLNFIKHCETPFTISIQGNWGSGKTSIMKSLEEDLCKSGNDNLKNKCCHDSNVIWFNAWEFSQFDMGDDISLNLLSKVINDITSGRYDLVSYGKEILKSLRIAFFNNNVNLSIDPVNYSNKVQKFEKLREKLENLILLKVGKLDKEKNKTCFKSKNLFQSLKYIIFKMIYAGKGNNKDSRLYFFIDDLDRLKPSKAIDVLETLKVFFDIKYCIFIIAVDYEIVKLGIKEKYGETLKNKESVYFDKFFQLPILLPEKQEEIKISVKSNASIKEIIGSESKELDKYCEMIEIASQYNLRTLNKIINTIIFYKTMYSNDDKNEKIHPLFIPIVCMKVAYIDLYTYIKSSSKNLDTVINDELSEKNIDQTLNECKIKIDLNIKKFIKTLVEILKIDNNLDKFANLIKENENLVMFPNENEADKDKNSDFDKFIENCKNQTVDLINDLKKIDDRFAVDLSAYNFRKQSFVISTSFSTNKDNDTDFYIGIEFKYIDHINKFKCILSIAKNRSKDEIKKNAKNSKMLHEIFKDEIIKYGNQTINGNEYMSSIKFKIDKEFDFSDKKEKEKLYKTVKKYIGNFVNLLNEAINKNNK